MFCLHGVRLWSGIIWDHLVSEHSALIAIDLVGAFTACIYCRAQQEQRQPCFHDPELAELVQQTVLQLQEAKSVLAAASTGVSSGDLTAGMVQGCSLQCVPVWHKGPGPGSQSAGKHADNHNDVPHAQ